MPASIQVVVVVLLLVNFAFASQAVMERYTDSACTKRIGTFAAATSCLAGETGEKAQGIISKQINCAAGIVTEFSDSSCSVMLNTAWDFVIDRCQQQKDSTTVWIKITSCDDSATLAPVTTGGVCSQTHLNVDCTGDIVQYGCVGPSDGVSCFQVGSAGLQISCADNKLYGYADTGCAGSAVLTQTLNTTVGHCYDHSKVYGCGAAGSSAPVLFLSFVILALCTVF